MIEKWLINKTWLIKYNLMHLRDNKCLYIDK